MHTKNKIFLLTATVLTVLVIVGFFLLRINQQPTLPLQVVFFSQEECEQTTGQPCLFRMCDYVPPGKTFEEVCGKNFKSGWAPQSSVQGKQ